MTAFLLDLHRVRDSSSPAASRASACGYSAYRTATPLAIARPGASSQADHGGLSRVTRHASDFGVSFGSGPVRAGAAAMPVRRCQVQLVQVVKDVVLSSSSAVRTRALVIEQWQDQRHDEHAARRA